MLRGCRGDGRVYVPRGSQLDIWFGLSGSGLRRGSTRCGFLVFPFSKLDNGQGLQHCSRNSSCSALPCSSHHMPGSVPFRVAMRSEGSNHDNDEEESSNDARNAV